MSSGPYRTLVCLVWSMPETFPFGSCLILVYFARKLQLYSPTFKSLKCTRRHQIVSKGYIINKVILWRFFKALFVYNFAGLFHSRFNSVIKLICWHCSVCHRVNIRRNLKLHITFQSCKKITGHFYETVNKICNLL